MPESNEGRVTWTSSKYKRRLLCVFTIAVTFVCFAVSATAFTVMFILFCFDCTWPNSLLVYLTGSGAILIIGIGITVLWILLFRKKPQDSSAPEVVVSEIPAGDVEKSPAPILPYNQPFVGASLINLPVYVTSIHSSNGDETSTIAMPDCFTSVHSTNGDETFAINLPDFTSLQSSNGVKTSAQNINEAEVSASGDPPDYFTTVQDAYGVSDPLLNAEFRRTHVPDTPPPTYKQALKMRPSTIKADTTSSRDLQLN